MAFNSVLSSGFTKMKGLFAASRARGVAGGLILLVVLLIVLLLVTFAFPKPDNTVTTTGNSPTAETQVSDQTSNQQPVINTQSTETAVLDTDTAYINIFKYRDPFKPQIESSGTANVVGLTGNIMGAQSIEQMLGNNSAAGNTAMTNTVNDSGVNGVEDAGSGSVADPANALSLKSITGQGGSKQAAFIYQGQEYLVKEGDMVGGSPYQLMEINEGSVTILNGDNRFTLQIGDEMVK